MRVETKFLRLTRAVMVGEKLGPWKVCWVGGWDKAGILYIVMVSRVRKERANGSKWPASDSGTQLCGGRGLLWLFDRAAMRMAESHGTCVQRVRDCPVERPQHDSLGTHRNGARPETSRPEFEEIAA